LLFLLVEGNDICSSSTTKRGQGFSLPHPCFSCFQWPFIAHLTKEKKNKGKNKMWGVAMVIRAWSSVAPLLWLWSSFEPPSNLPSLASWEVCKVRGRPEIGEFGGFTLSLLFYFSFFVIFKPKM
jgi:hypothetical protein